MVFSKNAQPPETSFGLDLSSFFRNYEEFKGNPWFAVKVDKLIDKDIIELLEKMMR
jgi:hypothetical protein